MIHYTCDVCLRPLPEDYERPKNLHGVLQRVCQVDDICPNCRQLGETLDLPTILLTEWRRLLPPTPAAEPEVAEAPAEPEPDPFRVNTVSDSDTMHVPILTAQAAEKQEILRRLKEYRAANGPSCLSGLAKKTRSRGRINDFTLRDVLNGSAVLGIEDWRRIGQALDAAAEEKAK